MERPRTDGPDWPTYVRAEVAKMGAWLNDPLHRDFATRALPGWRAELRRLSEAARVGDG